jgi:flagellar secretion chaperone FliS
MYRDAYLETEVLSASPVQLVEMLYRGAIESIDNSLSAIQRHDIAARNHSINRAHAIVNELATSLDHTHGGDLSRQLTELYDYIQRKLGEANFSQQMAPLQEARGLLVSLVEAWAAIGHAAPSGAGATDAFSGRVPGSANRLVDYGAGEGRSVDLKYAHVDSLG